MHKNITVLFFLSIISSCHRVQSGDILLYSDRGAAESCVIATKNMFEWMGYSVVLADADYINKNGVKGFKLICFPGGDMYQYSQDISEKAKEDIRDFIVDGGGYIGICGGAYFTGEKVYWRGSQLPMEPLEIFPGTTRGPIDQIAPYPHCVMCKVNLVDNTHPITVPEPDSAWIQYCYGPAFYPNNDADLSILGEYEIGDLPSIAAFDYGLGRVFIIGSHPEFEEDSDRDSISSCDTLDDRGSDWNLMKNAVHWCLKEEH